MLWHGAVGDAAGDEWAEDRGETAAHEYSDRGLLLPLVLE